MKLFQFLTLFLLPIFLLSCGDDDTATNSACNIDSSLLIDVDWIHSSGTLAELKFASSGIYYENGNNDGNWELENNCDSIYVTRPSNNFYYVIRSLTQNELVLANPAFGEITYVK